MNLIFSLFKNYSGYNHIYFILLRLILYYYVLFLLRKRCPNIFARTTKIISVPLSSSMFFSETLKSYTGTKQRELPAIPMLFGNVSLSCNEEMYPKLCVSYFQQQ